MWETLITAGERELIRKFREKQWKEERRACIHGERQLSSRRESARGSEGKHPVRQDLLCSSASRICRWVFHSRGSSGSFRRLLFVRGCGGRSKETSHSACLGSREEAVSLQLPELQASRLFFHAVRVPARLVIGQPHLPGASPRILHPSALWPLCCQMCPVPFPLQTVLLSPVLSMCL